MQGESYVSLGYVLPTLYNMTLKIKNTTHMSAHGEACKKAILNGIAERIAISHPEVQTELARR